MIGMKHAQKIDKIAEMIWDKYHAARDAGEECRCSWKNQDSDEKSTFIDMALEIEKILNGD